MLTVKNFARTCFNLSDFYVSKVVMDPSGNSHRRVPLGDIINTNDQG
jgi:hypothetical protein